MLIRKLRLEKGWSQEQLAACSGVSVRTIQRLERGAKGGLETLKCIAAALDIELSDLYEESNMSQKTLTTEEQQAYEYVRDIKGFYSHALTFVIFHTVFMTWSVLQSGMLGWTVWSFMGWGLGLGVHALNVFEITNFFDSQWEKKQVEKRLQAKRGNSPSDS